MTTFTQLRITGPGSSPYVLGTPLHVHDGETHVGTLDPVLVSIGGSEVHIEHFTPAKVAVHQKQEIGTLVLLEVASFIALNFVTVQAIRFSLSRDIEGYGDGLKLAGVRSGLLQSIGAGHILVTPKPDAAHAGHFVVAAVWEYNRANLAALATRLESERDAYREREARAAEARAARTGSWIRRLLQRSTPPAGADAEPD